eukprot:Colp12_sorted_trinity150504_noHs@14317
MKMADIKKLEALITAIPDFPLPGILFRDVFPIFRHPAAVELMLAHMIQHIQSVHDKIDVVVGLDARGFLFGPILAMRLGCSFAPIRKKGKLPGKVISEVYEKEYGKDVFEMQADAIPAGAKVLVVDDLLATGGTMSAAVKLVSKAGGEVVEGLVIVELTALKGAAVVGLPVYSLIKYDD